MPKLWIYLVTGNMVTMAGLQGCDRNVMVTAVKMEKDWLGSG